MASRHSKVAYPPPEPAAPCGGLGGALRGTLQKLALLAVGIGVGLIVAELVVRWVEPQQLTILRPDIWIPDQGLGWRRTAHLSTRINTGERTVGFFTDEHGHRIGRRKITSNPNVRVLALGDSFVEALQVEYEDSMTGRIETVLAGAYDTARVVTAGVAGYGPNQYLIQVRAELREADYDAVVVFLFLGNDIERERRERIPAKRPETVHPLRWPRKLQARELIDSFLYPINDALEQRSHLFVLLRSRLPFVKSRLVAVRRASKDDTADPRVLFRHHVLNRDLADSERWSLTAEICADLADEARQHGVPTLFVLLPSKSWIDTEALRLEAASLGIDPRSMDVEQPFRIMKRELLARGLAVVDTFDTLRRAFKDGRRDLFGRVDTHFAPAGHALVAEKVLPTLRQLLAEGLSEKDEEPAAEPDSGATREQ